MKEKSWFDKLINKCEKCGKLFGRHDMFDHMVKDMLKGIEDIAPLAMQNEPAQTFNNTVMNKMIDNKNTQGPIAIPNLIKIQAEVEFGKANAVKLYPSHPDLLTDFNYWIQAFGFMTYRAMKYQEWSKEKILKHVNEELGKCIEAHTFKR